MYPKFQHYELRMLSTRKLLLAAFQTSAAKCINTALFRADTQRVVVIPWTLKMGPIGFPETSEGITTTRCATALKSAVLKAFLSRDPYNKKKYFPIQ